MDPNTKPWWQSKTVIASFVAMFAGVFGGVSQATQEEATVSILSIVVAVAGLVGVISRIVAKRKIA